MRFGKRIGATIARGRTHRRRDGVGIAGQILPRQWSDEYRGHGRLLGEPIAHLRHGESESAGAPRDGFYGAAVRANPEIRVGQRHRVVKFRTRDNTAAPTASKINPAILGPLRAIYATPQFTDAEPGKE